jgi:hypothetical protein
VERELRNLVDGIAALEQATPRLLEQLMEIELFDAELAGSGECGATFATRNIRGTRRPPICDSR